MTYCSTSVSSRDRDTLLDGLIAYYPFESSVNDTTEFKLNGINHSCDYEEAIIGNGIRLNGIDSWVEIPHDSLFNSTEKSIQFWFYKSNGFIHDTPNTWDVEGLIFKSFDTHSYRDFSFQIANQEPPFNIGFQTIGPDSSYSCGQLSSIQPNQWYHIIGIINETDISLYINGDLVNSKAIANDIVNTEAPIVIGKASYYSYPTRFFNGIIDELRLYNRALTEEEIKLLCTLR